jgi:hypothetical protein
VRRTRAHQLRIRLATSFQLSAENEQPLAPEHRRHNRNRFNLYALPSKQGLRLKLAQWQAPGRATLCHSGLLDVVKLQPVSNPASAAQAGLREPRRCLYHSQSSARARRPSLVDRGH